MTDLKDSQGGEQVDVMNILKKVVNFLEIPKFASSRKLTALPRSLQCGNTYVDISVCPF